MGNTALERGFKVFLLNILVAILMMIINVVLFFICGILGLTAGLGTASIVPIIGGTIITVIISWLLSFFIVGFIFNKKRLTWVLK